MHSLLKKLIILTWFVLLALLATRDLFIPGIDSGELAILQKARQERYYGVWFNQQRIGYVVEKLEPSGQDIVMDQEAHLLLNVLETTQPIDMYVQARLSGSLLLQNFDFRFQSPFYTMSANGEVDGNKVSFRLDTGQATITDTIVLSEPPLLAVNDRSYLLGKLTREGQKIKVPSFDPVTLTGRESIVTYHGQEKTLIRRRVKLLHRFSEVAAGMRVSFWLDEDGRVVKEESPAGFTFIAEPEFRAKDIVSSGNELLRSVAVPLKGKMPADGADRITFRLTMPPDLDLDLEGGRQTLEGNLLTVVREHVPTHARQIAPGPCDRPEFRSPSRYVQSDNDAIVSLARSVVGTETDQAIQVRLLARWVFENLEKRPVIGLPDALSTLKTRKGDCNEHASLFAALTRSVGITTAIATGVTLQGDALYYHAWNEVCLNGKWYSLDTTTDQIPADLFHIRFGRGDMDQQLKIGGLLGRLAVEIVPTRQ